MSSSLGLPKNGSKRIKPKSKTKRRVDRHAFFGRWQDEPGHIHADQALAPEGQTVTEGAFALNPNQKYFRIDVVDECGRIANSQAYFLDELTEYLK